MRIDNNLMSSLWWNQTAQATDGSTDDAQASGLPTPDSILGGGDSSFAPNLMPMFEEVRKKILQKMAEQQYKDGTAEETEKTGAAVWDELKKAGLNVGESVSLTLDEAGDVRVAGAHPEKAKIEAYFAAHTDLGDTFAETYVRNEVVQTINRGQLAKMSKNPYLKNMVAWEKCAITISEDATKVSFV